MSPDRNRLHIAIQKSGRLSDLSRQLLKDSGLRISEGGRTISPRAPKISRST